MTTTAVLYFDEYGEELIGRALTTEEYENITAQELLDAVNHPSACGMGTAWPDWEPQNAYEEKLARDFRTPERVYKDLTAQEIKELLKKGEFLLIHSNEPMARIEPPRFTKGPNEGEYNFFNKDKDAWKETKDRWYTIENKDEVIAVEAEIDGDEGFDVINSSEVEAKVQRLVKERNAVAA
jgi:hypothetical protein